MSTVSENIRYLRKLKGYTQEQFAGQIGIKRSLLGAYEEARANPNEIYLDSMAELLGVPVEHLLNENLKERGRTPGTGTILKLNPGLGEPEVKPVSPVEKGMAESSSVPEGDRGGSAQMDLFGIASAKTATVDTIQPAKGKAVSSPPKTNADIEFADLLGRMLPGNMGFRLFSDLEDLPLPGLHLIGQRLNSAAEIENNSLYILVSREDRFFFRRAFNLLEIKGTIILSSDFPDKPTLEFSVSDIREVYRYTASMQTGAPSPIAPVRKLKDLTEEMMRLLGSR